MLTKLLGIVPDSFYSLLLSPSFRYSSHFGQWENLFSYSEKERVLKIAMEFARHSQLEGEYLEFGVFEGANFVAAFHLAQVCGLTSMRFYAFDSFQGLPKVKGPDAEGFRHFEEGEFHCDTAKFSQGIASKGVDLDKVSIVPGWFEETLNNQTKMTLPLTKAAVVYIDCDLYESTLPVLNFLTDYLQDGSVVLFDDWYCYRGDPNRGEQRAFKEWLTTHSDLSATEFHKYGWHGNSFIIHRRQ